MNKEEILDLIELYAETIASARLNAHYAMTAHSYCDDYERESRADYRKAQEIMNKIEAML